MGKDRANYFVDDEGTRARSFVTLLEALLAQGQFMKRRRMLMALAAGVALPGAGAASTYAKPLLPVSRDASVLVAATPGSLAAADLAVGLAFRAIDVLVDQGLIPGLSLGYLADAPIAGAFAVDIARDPRFLARQSIATVLFRCEDEEPGLRLHAMLLEHGRPFVQVRPDSVQTIADDCVLRARATSFGFDVCFPTPWDQQISAQFDAARGAEPDCGLAAFEAAGFAFNDLVRRRNAYHGHILAAVLLAIWGTGGLTGLGDRPLGSIIVGRRPDGSLAGTEVFFEGSVTA